ncbi:MAG: transposon-encoded TnpW family protein [Butyrivibrio sp.]|nr:transposon-encoded TnpW family protein [Butyrivibrio sp.]MBP3814628.1 transposon-encoded TnpW family protein [Butyrivibrio sp.]
MENEKNLIPEQESAVVDNDTCASSLPTSTVTRTIGKTTYIANLHFKEQGQTFAQKLKRVLSAECSV